MKFIDDPTGSLTKPTKSAAAAGRWFTDGDPATSVPATRVKAEWLNMVQAELDGIVAYGGLTQDKSNDAQVISALLLKFATLLSPAFSGTPTAPTPAPGDNSTKLATTEFVVANGSFVTGMVCSTILTTAPAGWVMLNDGSIGNAASGATTRANADTQALFVALWSSHADAYAPVSGGRGASAIADFTANKRISLPRAAGRVIGVAGSGASLTARPLGSFVGVETVSLSVGEMPVHYHTGITNNAGIHQHQQGSEAMYSIFGGGNLIGLRNWKYDGENNQLFYDTQLTSAAGDHGHTFTTDFAGSGGAHVNMQPTIFFNAMIKL